MVEVDVADSNEAVSVGVEVIDNTAQHFTQLVTLMPRI